MNITQAKNNRYKNGEYNPNHSIQMVKEKAKNEIPTKNQVKYRDDLLNFCRQKGLVRDGFIVHRTRQGIRSNIYALNSILRKNGLDGEFYGKGEQNNERENNV
jgi:hypothetical protein